MDANLARRRLLACGAASAFSIATADHVVGRGTVACSEGRGCTIRRVEVGSPITVPDNYGDTWVTTWADDGHLYTPSNDTLGFGIPGFFDQEQVKSFSADGSAWSKQLTQDQKARFVRQFGTIALNRVEGDDPRHLRGTTVNRMQESVRQDEFGTIFDEHPAKPADGQYWKSSGCTFVDGALYWAIRRDKYPDSAEVKGMRQSATNASIIKSMDYGRSWTRSAKDNLESPMFPGDGFATPYFVDYGRSRATIDGADLHVYAISNNGYWDNGDALIIGRVRRDRLGRLDIGSHTWSPEGYYWPSACPKFQSADRIYVITAGDFHNWWDHYHLTLVPVDLSG